jgi:hypothetical protein
MKLEDLFEQLFQAATEEEVDQVIKQHPDIFADANWTALGGNR